MSKLFQSDGLNITCTNLSDVRKTIMSHPNLSPVTPTIHCILRRSYFTCSYLVEHAAGLIAIDAGMKSTGTEMLHAIAALKRPVTDVKAILITHWHNDHAA